MTTNTKPRDPHVRYCSPNCQFFKCTKRSMGANRTVQGRNRITCNFVDGDWCTGSRCTYSLCVKHKMKPDGACGLQERSGPEVDEDLVEQKYETELVKKERNENQYQAYLKDKYRKKLQPKSKKW
ncbi:MAG: hypothetical protein LUQ65_11165 [Candidatus Helarchaeota archaeon]|nr:hypothetical protein [Candidatus Helarchaeota archaeon]